MAAVLPMARGPVAPVERGVLFADTCDVSTPDAMAAAVGEGEGEGAPAVSPSHRSPSLLLKVAPTAAAPLQLSPLSMPLPLRCPAVANPANTTPSSVPAAATAVAPVVLVIPPLPGSTARSSLSPLVPPPMLPLEPQ